ncbi:MAG: putative metalloprotease CJM1_0395 family protein [Pseudomonadota bacterium]
MITFSKNRRRGNASLTLIVQLCVMFAPLSAVAATVSPLRPAEPAPAAASSPGAGARASGGATPATSGGVRVVDVSRVAPVSAVQPVAAQAPFSEIEAAASSEQSPSARSGSGAPGDLTEGERRQVEELQARDREVRAHEQAHKAVGGRYAGAISYEYTTGPDGQRYAVGGEVPIDIAPEDDPAATVEKMQVVIAAALAPAEPSPQDRAVASMARQQLAAAQADLQVQRAAEARGESPDDDAEDAAGGPPPVDLAAVREAYDRAAAGVARAGSPLTLSRVA